MKPDLYTKAVLTVIALMLTVIACKTVITPTTTASAQGPFAGVQFVVDRGGFEFFDQRTGEVWEYFGSDGRLQSGGTSFKTGQLARTLKLTKPGQPMTVEYQAK